MKELLNRSATSSQSSLSGIKILLIEDDFLQAQAMADLLEDAGAIVIGPIRRCDHALRAVAEERIDCALLDINLGGGADFTLAGAFKERGLPFIFVTGYAGNTIPDAFRDVARCTKPADPARVIELVARVAAG